MLEIPIGNYFYWNATILFYYFYLFNYLMFICVYMFLGI